MEETYNFHQHFGKFHWVYFLLSLMVGSFIISATSAETSIFFALILALKFCIMLSIDIFLLLLRDFFFNERSWLVYTILGFESNVPMLLLCSALILNPRYCVTVIVNGFAGFIRLIFPFALTSQSKSYRYYRTVESDGCYLFHSPDLA